MHFTDTSTCQPDAWLWDFGDGAISTDQNPEHVFPGGRSQDFQVTLTVSKDGICFGQATQVVSVLQPGASVPQEPVGSLSKHGLVESGPNPFSATTVIHYELSEVGPVRLQLYDTQGRLVRTLVNGTGQAGKFQVEWDGLDDGGLPAAPGFYLCRLCSNGNAETVRIVLAK